MTIKIGADSLPSHVLSNSDTFEFDWVLNKKSVQITVLSDKGKYQAFIRLDLDNLVELPSSKKKRRKKRAETCQPSDDTKLFLNLIVRQCKSPLTDGFVYAEVKPQRSNLKFKVMGRATKKDGLYEVILPRKKSSGNKNDLCQCYSKV